MNKSFRTALALAVFACASLLLICAGFRAIGLRIDVRHRYR